MTLCDVGCHREFSRSQCFVAHTQANLHCAHALLARRERNPDGTSRPVNARLRRHWGGNTDAFVENIDTMLQEEQQRMEAMRLREGDDGNNVFEFQDDDDDTGSPACKRVRLESLADMSSDDDDSVLAKESRSLGSTERVLGSPERNVESAESADRVVEVEITAEGSNLRFVGGNEEEMEDDFEEEKSIKEFKAYCERANKDNRCLSPDVAASIELMSLMNEKGGSIALCDAVCEWHRKHIRSKETIESEKLHQKLVDRYNLKPTL